MGTTLEGDWKEIMAAAEACPEAVRGSHRRVWTNSSIDDDSSQRQTIGEAMEKVQQKKHANA